MFMLMRVCFDFFEHIGDVGKFGLIGVAVVPVVVY